MNPMNTRRNFFGNMVALSVASTLVLPKQAQAIGPFTGALTIAIATPIVTAISMLYSEKKRLEREDQQRALAISQMREQRIYAQIQHVREWLEFGVRGNQITYQAATNAFSSTLANLTLADDFDGRGTRVEVKNGVLQVERGIYSGSLHAGSIRHVHGKYHDSGDFPVPVSSAYMISSDDKTKLIDKIAEGQRMDGSVFDKDYAIYSARDFSGARRPTERGADSTLVAVFNREELSLSKGRYATAHFLTA